MTFLPQKLTCPDSTGCPVPGSLPGQRATTLASGTLLFHAYDATWGYDEHNPGYGDARFSPFDAAASGRRVPAMYLAQTETAALLETVFREVHQTSSRQIYEKDLRGMMLAHLRVPRDAVLGDLRDPELSRHGLDREQVVATSAEHYPCTRRLAVAAHRRQLDGRSCEGLIWHSRQVELAGGAATEVAVLFGDEYPSGRGTWTLAGPGCRNLFEGPGRLLIDTIAEALSAVVQPEH